MNTWVKSVLRRLYTSPAVLIGFVIAHWYGMRRGRSAEAERADGREARRLRERAEERTQRALTGQEVEREVANLDDDAAARRLRERWTRD